MRRKIRELGHTDYLTFCNGGTGAYVNSYMTDCGKEGILLLYFFS